jgi:hypothetical protein
MFFQWQDKWSDSSQKKKKGKTINLVQASNLTRGKTAGPVASNIQAISHIVWFKKKKNSIYLFRKSHIPKQTK